jgi:hypothetical protein
MFVQHFLERYFGTNTQIVSYAKLLISMNQRDALREVNEAVNLLGSNVCPSVIINKIDQKWLLGVYGKKLVLARQIIELNVGAVLLEKSIEFISLVCGPLTKTPRLRYALHTEDKGTYYFDEISIQDHAKKLATEFLSV